VHRAVVRTSAPGRRWSTSWSGRTNAPGPSSRRRPPTAHGASTWRTPISRRAHRLARYGMRWGGNRWSRPCRGRNATRRPPMSAIVIGSDGCPYGVEIWCSSAPSSSRYSPEPPITPTSASTLTGRL
jgi:hypothetical protein